MGIRLLADLRMVFGQNDVMSTDTLLSLLHKIEEAPWSDLRGKALTDRGLAQRLRQYGVRSKVVRVGAATPRGYAREDFHDAWTRYLGPLPMEGATSATSTTLNEATL